MSENKKTPQDVRDQGEWKISSNRGEEILRIICVLKWLVKLILPLMIYTVTFYCLNAVLKIDVYYWKYMLGLILTSVCYLYCDVLE